MPKKKITSNFEKNLQELEILVEKMSSGELSLEESLANFEKGVSLVKTCQESLAKAEQKINILLSQDGLQTLQQFSASDSGNEQEGHPGS